MLSSWILRAEAEHCRLLAAEFAGRPEGLVSLRLADAFDELDVKSGMRTHEGQTGLAVLRSTGPLAHRLMPAIGTAARAAAPTPPAVRRMLEWKTSLRARTSDGSSSS